VAARYRGADALRVTGARWQPMGRRGRRDQRLPLRGRHALQYLVVSREPGPCDPLEVKLDRQPNPYIDFASGWHRRLGSHLARLELRVGMEEWHARIPEYSIQPGVDVPYIPLGVRQPTTLPLVW
jgi:hypothetical protein